MLWFDALSLFHRLPSLQIGPALIGVAYALIGVVVRLDGASYLGGLYGLVTVWGTNVYGFS